MTDADLPPEPPDDPTTDWATQPPSDAVDGLPLVTDDTLIDLGDDTLLDAGDTMLEDLDDLDEPVIDPADDVLEPPPSPSSYEGPPLGDSTSSREPILLATDSGRLDDDTSSRVELRALDRDTGRISPYEPGAALPSKLPFDEPDYDSPPMVHLENIFKSFGKRQILRGVDLEVYAGETICIIGGSGTGKSVSLKHIMRLLNPDRGKIWLDGEDITRVYGDRLQKARSKLGVNFQFGALLNWMTIFENVALPLRENTDMRAPEIERRVMAKLELLSIPHARDLYPTQISGGMVKRAGLARAVVMEESLKVILYDEPTSGLDPISTAVVDEMVNEMKSRLGLTQIIVTHDMASAYRTANRIAVLHEGKVVQFGTPEEIQASRVPYVQQFVRGLSTQEALVERTASGRFKSSRLKKLLED